MTSTLRSESFPGSPLASGLVVIASVVYLFFSVYSFTHFGVLHQITMGHVVGPADPTLRGVLIEGAFSWWVVGSYAGFCLVIVFWGIDCVARTLAWVYSRIGDASIAVPSPGRRRFIERTAIMLSATPFIGAAYVLLYGRLDIEVTRQRHPSAPPSQGFRGLSHCPAFRYPHQPVHARGPNSPLRHDH